MKHSDIALNAQQQELLKLVEQNRERRCNEILEGARQQAGAIVHQSYREARARLHQAVEEERRRTGERIAAAQAELQGRRRRRGQDQARRLLEEAWPPLETALERRWRDDHSRAQWLDQLVAQALERLPAGHWRIIHPPGWGDREREDLASRLAKDGGEAPRFEVDSQLKAGLRIHTDGVCLDGSSQGLLHDRSAIEAQLLHELMPLLGFEPPSTSTQEGDRSP